MRLSNQFQRSAVATSFCSKFTDDKCHLALVSNGFIHKQLAESKVSKATGLGGLPFRLLKVSVVTISVRFTHIANLLITTQCVPHDWKHTKVISLYKDGARDDIDNYRPISILSVVSKILERAVQQRLVDYLESRDLFSRYQCEFRRKYSAQTGITFLTDSIRRSVDAELRTDAIFVDFCKAFDAIDHKI